MANHETNWILSLVDNISKPIREITGITNKTLTAVERVVGSLNIMDEATREVAETSIKSHRELTDLYDKQEQKVSSLKKHLEGLSDPLSRGAVQFDISQAETQMRRYREQLSNIENDLDEIELGPDPAKMKANWGEAVVVANQLTELAEKAIAGLSFTTGTENLKADLQRITGFAEEQVDELAGIVSRIAGIYDQNGMSVVRAANAMTKQIGGTYEENFALIEAGFQKGANLNEDFIDQLKEYAPHIRANGLSAAEGIALMAHAGKQGIFSDKAIDSIKEADMSIKEMGQAQADALIALGLKTKDFAGKTSFEIAQIISKAMATASPQARQLALADIFKGAGEDAGMAWILGLSSIDLSLDNIPSIQQANSGILGWLSDLKMSFSDTFGSIGSSVVALAPVVTGIASMIPIISMLSKVTWIQTTATKIATIAQWAWNVAMTANPIGLIIMAIGALIAIIVAVVSQTQGWGEMWDHTVKGAQYLWDGFIAGAKWGWDTMVNSLMIGLNKIKQGWYEFKNATGLGNEDENNAMIAQIDADTKARQKAIVDGAKKVVELGKKAEEEFILAAQSVKWKDKKEADGSGAGSAGTLDFSNLHGAAPALDGTTKLSGTGAGTGGGSTGSRILNMTLNVNQVFNVKDGADFIRRKREIMDEMVGEINDALKDSLIAAG